MEIAITIMLAFAGGVALGWIFFWGLWKTVERMAAVKRPYLWMISSFLLRTLIVLAGFYLILRFQWQLVAVALLGFIAARMLIVGRSLSPHIK